MIKIFIGNGLCPDNEWREEEKKSEVKFHDTALFDFKITTINLMDWLNFEDK
ncbi:hypothetical protein MASR2M41_15080 [Flammeovirgaceae bacterium]